MTADQLVERLVEINRPEYQVLVVLADPDSAIPDEADLDIFEPRTAWTVTDVRRANDVGSLIEVVVQ